MANIPVAPFYVPRPAEEQLWSKLPVRSPIIPFLTQQKMFGVGGQVTTKQWGPIYNYDVGESFWNAAPIDSPIIAYLTKQKMFGVGGQVPAKQWNGIYTFDDPAVWKAAPVSSKYVPVVNFPFFAKHQFTYDDSPCWVAQPLNSAAVSSVTATYLFEGPFFVPNYDDSPCWAAQPLNSVAVSAVFTTYLFEGPFFVPNYDDSPCWAGQPLNPVAVSATVTTTLPEAAFFVPQYDDAPGWIGHSTYFKQTVVIQAAPFVANKSDFGVIDSPVWQGAPIFSKTLHPLLTAAGQVSSHQWLFGYDDQTYWASKPVSAATPYMPTVAKPIVPASWNFNNVDADVCWWQWSNRDQALLTVQPTTKPPAVHQWMFGYDDASVWSGSSDSSAAIPMLTVGGIIKAKQWRWDHDVGETFWNTPPKASATIPMLTIGGIIKAKQWEWHSDDSSVWWNWINRDLVIRTIQPTPLLSTFWPFNNDDPPPWRQPSQRSIGLPFVPAIVDHWRAEIPDDQPWSLSLQRDLVANTIQPKPFISVAWRFNNDDASPWQQPSQRSVALPFVPAILNRWHLDPADEQPWSLTAQYNLSASVQAPLVGRRRSDTSDDQPWSPATQRDLSLVATPFAAKLFSFVAEDAVWQLQAQQRSRVYFFKPEIPVFWPFNHDDPSLSWRQAAQRSAAVGALPQFPPFTLRQPSFAWDNFPSWQWRAKNNRFLPYYFTLSPRFATAPAELRSADAALELRSVDASAEARSGDATAPDRLGTANSPVRSSDTESGT